MTPIRETRAMIAGMTPELQPGRFVFCAVTEPLDVVPLALFREAEGLSALLAVEDAVLLGHPIEHPMRQITLKVFSALDGIGLTAAVAARLTELEIPCNVVAALRHDHIFVPEDLAHRAVEGLVALQEEASAS